MQRKYRRFTWALAIAVFFVCAISGMTHDLRRVEADGGSAESEVVASDLLAHMNNARTAEGLPSLMADIPVYEVAAERAREMASLNEIGHTSPAGVGPPELLWNAGIAYEVVGENVARTNVAAEVVAPLVANAWMASELHRANVLDARFGHVGIGIALSGPMFYISVVFLT